MNCMNCKSVVDVGMEICPNCGFNLRVQRKCFSLSNMYYNLGLDIKALDPELCVRLTGRDGGNTLATLDWCEESGKPVWIRHVLVPGLTLDRARLEALAAYLEPYRCIGKVELLPFHKMADFKWKALGLENRLADTPEPEAAALREAESLFSGRSRDCRQP